MDIWRVIFITSESKNKKFITKASRGVERGINDLQTLYPSVADEWHLQKNGSVTPDMVTAHSGAYAWWKCHKGHEWEARILNRTRKDGPTGCPYCAGKSVSPGENDLAALYPSVAQEWHPTKNGSLTPDNVTAHSHKSVWWKCPEGHEWQATIINRTQKNNGTGCPYCSGRRAIPGQTDIATLYPAVAAEWHPTKNGDLLPYITSSQSHSLVWWLCPEGHEWQSHVYNRTCKINISNCPYCGNKKIIPGENDLATFFPNLVKEWHPSKNGVLTPHNVSPYSNRHVWWLCDKGHEWQAVISSRTSKNQSGCPCCARNKVIPGETDLATCYPKIAAEWHPVKNGNLTPDMVAAQSSYRAWWLCPKGHEWQAYVDNRTNKKTGCPCCNERYLVPGENDLASLYPSVAAEWHPTKNGALTSRDVTAHSRKDIWWQCSKDSDHVWRTRICNRTKEIEPSGCPFCAGVRVIKGKNDLATLYPNIAAEWHPTKNGELTPDTVTAHSSKSVWWQCKEGHAWQARVSSRTRKDGPTGCPDCARQKRLMKTFANEL